MVIVGRRITNQKETDSGEDVNDTFREVIRE